MKTTNLEPKKFEVFCFILWGRAAVAHWAHNPRVAGSNPAPATND